MDAGVEIFNLNGINLLGMQRTPRKRADNYVHKDQLKFWSYEGEEDEECAEFRRRFRFRKDTVKVLPIAAPWNYPEQFINWNKYLSINSQMIVSHRGAITHLSTRWLGSAHDSRILRDSYIQDLLDSNFLQNYYLLEMQGMHAS